jgi:hypothetical protein
VNGIGQMLDWIYFVNGTKIRENFGKIENQEADVIG